MYIYICVCMYVCMYVCIYVYICVCLNMYADECMRIYMLKDLSVASKVSLKLMSPWGVVAKDRYAFAKSMLAFDNNSEAPEQRRQ